MIHWKSLDDALGDVYVYQVEDYHNEAAGGGLSAILGWWAVDAAESATVAYFATEAQAFHYRLAVINARLNPLNIRLDGTDDFDKENV